MARDPRRANLVARIRGTGDGPSLAFTGHTDVVPADARDWQHPPFSAHLDDDGFVWGRGAVDMKCQTAMGAVAIAALARSGFQAPGDLVYIAQADEEDGDARVGMHWLTRERPDLRVDYAIDEGGGLLLTLPDGRVVVPICVAEKQCLPVRVTALGEAGHASTPTVGANAVPLIAELIGRIARHRTARHLTPVTARMLEVLGVSLDGGLDAAIAEAASLHPSFEHGIPALFGATLAPTRLVGSSARNVMPGRASVEVDCRLLPGQGHAELEVELRAALGDDIPYELEYLDEPSGGSVAELDTPLYRSCQAWLDRARPGAVLLPELSSGFIDSYFMRTGWGTASYGLFPTWHTPVEILDGTVHNRDERIHVDDLLLGLDFLLDVARTFWQQG